MGAKLLLLSLVRYIVPRKFINFWNNTPLAAFSFDETRATSSVAAAIKKNRTQKNTGIEPVLLFIDT